MKVAVRMLLSALLAGLIALPVAAQTDKTSSSGQASGTKSSQSSSTDQSSKKTTSGTATKSSKATSGAEKVPSADQAFVKKAAQADMAEVELGQLAQQKASNDSVKNFAKRMVDDHSKNLDEVKTLAQQKGITLPDKPAAKDEALKSRLEKLSGPAFDKQYMSNMVKDHTKDVAEFKSETTKAKDPDVKSYAQKTLPTLQEHLQLAKSSTPGGAAGKTQKSEAKPPKSSMR